MKTALCLLLLSSWTFAMPEGMPNVEVLVNGSGPYRFAVDTGASSSLISTRIAAALGLKPEYQVRMVTASGERLIPAGTGTTLAVPGLERQGTEVLWCDWPMQDGVDGILGQSFLAGQSYMIDTRRRSVQFGPLSPPDRATLQPVEWIEGRMAVLAEGPGGLALRLVVDSGASHLMLWPKRPIPLIQTGLAFASSHAGQIRVETGQLSWLRVGHIQLNDIPAGILPGTREEDGLLDTRSFRRVYVLGSQIAFER
ncbi:retropepsin-like aspartic protease [uncultured Paludibaculum sp.]|uniref:retropepsin-like aspartic protease n=1 Tax=uncultured Paludibaculum sp. TaxID=1765020 RepID=UPI002AAAC985|nr:retropepsin-like aspartic protease [uncultured Paludibaculum sp.]